jgi:hypothetical protein
MLFGLLGFVIYVAVAHPTGLGSFAIAAQGALWVVLFARLTRVLVRDRPRSRPQLARVAGGAWPLLLVTIGLLLDGGAQAGWADGPFRYAMAGVGLMLLLAIAAYWVIGQGRLRAVPERHAGGRQTP